MKIFKSTPLNEELGILLIAANSKEEAESFLEKELVEKNVYTYYYRTYVEMSCPEELVGVTMDVDKPQIIMERL